MRYVWDREKGVVMERVVGDGESVVQQRLNPRTSRDLLLLEQKFDKTDGVISKLVVKIRQKHVFEMSAIRKSMLFTL